jgi:4-amino-4-deoxy-L-arabinose transferase-like glycosyltransferase
MIAAPGERTQISSRERRRALSAPENLGGSGLAPLAVLLCSVLAAATVAVDGYISAHVGYLARPPAYDGVSYMLSAQSAAHQLESLHLRAGLQTMNDTIAPLWTALLTLHYIVLGDGAWHAFSARFWPVALILILVYWVVRGRAPRSVAVAVVVLTSLLPVAAAGLRASSWEYFGGQLNLDLGFGLDDLRPDFMAAALSLWSVATLFEPRSPTTPRWYFASAVFASLAVLIKQSTAPVVLALWGTALFVSWMRARWDRRALISSALAVVVFALMLAPWAVIGHGAAGVFTYLTALDAYKAAYGTSDDLFQRLAYFPSLLPVQLGPLEALIAVVGVAGVLALMRRRIGIAEAIYGADALIVYVVFSLPTVRNSHLGVWVSLALWVFFVATTSRAAAGTRWMTRSPAPRAILAGVSLYACLIYGLGLVSVAGWPANERTALSQEVEVTSAVAQELGGHLGPQQCFTYAPGPGWPASIQLAVAASRGSSPTSTPTDIATATTTIVQYLVFARRCDAFLVYEQAMPTVATAFYAPAAYQPYFQALSDWVRTAGSGYSLDRQWTFSDLPPSQPHRLGNYAGVTLTVDLYLRDGAP